MTIQEIEDKYLIPLYKKREIALVRGEGAMVIDENGRQYLDLTSQFGAAILGYNNRQINEALKNQLDSIISVHSSFYNKARADFISELNRVVDSKLQNYFFCSSGTEATEAALKFAHLSRPDKKVLAFSGSYHGRTIGSLSRTGVSKYRESFQSLLSQTIFAEFDSLESLVENFTEEVGVVIVEPIQGEGGIKVASPEFLAKVRDLCDQHQAILILDEIQTGVGRTGTMFAYEQYQIIPDILLISKAIGSGLPLGLVAVNDRIASKIEAGIHGTTFGGNALACMAGASTLKYIREHNLLAEVKDKGEWLKEEIQKLNLPVIREVRGRGLMIGIELKQRVGTYLKKFQDQGFLVMNAGSLVIRLLPPYIITKDQLSDFLEKLKEILQ